MTLSELHTICKRHTHALIKTYLNDAFSASSLLKEAILHSVSTGGKYLRPLLIYMWAEILNVPHDLLAAPAFAIEIIHTYSLIHDDLPAMDNADLRRGKASCHKEYGEAIAILAGDTLQSLAYQVLAEHPSNMTDTQRLQMIRVLSLASGLSGIAAGQALDMSESNNTKDLKSLDNLNYYKTGSLLVAPLKMVALLAKSSHPFIDNLSRYMEKIALAYQIQDDVLDMESETTLLGKKVGIDRVNNKMTYPSLLGIEGAKEKVATLFSEAMDSVETLSSPLLLEFANTLLNRKN